LLAERRTAAIDAVSEREQAAAALAAEAGAHHTAQPAIKGLEADGGAAAAECGAYDTAHREIEGLEADVEAARSEVFSAINSATALRHALEHAAAAPQCGAETRH